MRELNNKDLKTRDNIEEKYYKVEARFENTYIHNVFKFKYYIKCKDSHAASNVCELFPNLLDDFDDFTFDVKEISLNKFLKIKFKNCVMEIKC